MNIAAWKEANDDVSGARQEGDASGKTVITKQPPPSSSLSSSWLRSKDPRIVRVSRAFGGKDRHSKVCTLRGLRDRRVRLSVPTAIQLYDLQERLGVDQPSKVVDWLLDAAKDEIDELPPLPISPENFSLLSHHHHNRHHQPFLNLNPGLGPSQEPGQIGFKIGGDDSTLANEDEEEERSREEENDQEHGKNESVLSNNNIPQQHHHHPHVGSYGSYYSLDHHHPHHHSGFQTDHHHQNHNLVPFPSQILVCPTTTATTQSLFPSPGTTTVEMMDPRQMVNQFQIPGSSQNMSALYSLIHGGAHNVRMPVHFNLANTATATANANAGTVSRILGSERGTSGGSDHPN